jgi:hypothetical protein
MGCCHRASALTELDRERARLFGSVVKAVQRAELVSHRRLCADSTF